MGPRELKQYAAESAEQKAEVETELKRRWNSFTAIPKTPFKSILDD